MSTYAGVSDMSRMICSGHPDRTYEKSHAEDGHARARIEWLVPRQRVFDLRIKNGSQEVHQLCSWIQQQKAARSHQSVHKSRWCAQQQPLPPAKLGTCTARNRWQENAAGLGEGAKSRNSRFYKRLPLLVELLFWILMSTSSGGELSKRTDL